MLWDSEQDKCDVEVVEAILDFGFIDINTLEQDPAIVHTLRISLQTRNPIDLVEVRMTSSLAESAKAKPEYFTPDFSGVERMEDGMDYCLDIEFTPEGIRRRYQDRVELVFENIKVRQRFIITRLVTAIVGTQKDVHLFGPPIQHSYPIHSMLKPPENDDEESADSRELFAHIPRFVRDALEDGSDQDKIERVKRSILPPKLNADSHRMHWKTILWIEELLEMRGLRQYDMSGELQEYESKARTFYTCQFVT
ncbi:hypothetical protein FRC03_010833 [Tulasnella sp. 419]|nr:hypothetical protein FRC03_010833 [Tulasnella sp. 419]